jgi:type II secretory pathway component PulF
MDYDEIIIRSFLFALVFAVWALAIVGFVALAHFFLTLPMRRAERARLFLDVLDDALQRGQSAEQAIASIAAARDLSMGARFHIVAAWIENNLPLLDALAKVPRFLPPQIVAMLNAGRKIGDIRKVLPACRQLLGDSISHTRSAINYLIILTFVITPMSIWVMWAMNIFVLPKIHEIQTTYIAAAERQFLSNILFQHGFALALLQFLALLAIWCGAFIYAAGPRTSRWFPFLESIHMLMPWRRKRLQRDFSAMLAILLDSGVPEADAVALAAECTANNIFERRAARTVEALKRGVALPQAIQLMDDSGEFGWRLTNAMRQRAAFCQALHGWHAWLDAKAFQQEQAAAHTITSGLVLWTGAIVAIVVISVFSVLISITNTGAQL